MRFLSPSALLFLASSLVAADPVAVSPDGRVQIELSLRDGVPHYRVQFRKATVVDHARLGIAWADGSAFGAACAIVSAEPATIREEYTQVSGKRRSVVSKANEVVVTLRETGTKRTWVMVLRAADDGAAFRYRFPKQDGWETPTIASERTEFRLPADATAFALPLNGFTTSHEKRYEAKAAKDVPKSYLLGLPLTLALPDGTFAAITEANVNEYAGLYLAPVGDGNFAARLSPSPKDKAAAVRVTLPHVSPWRVIMLGDRIGALVESDCVLNLSEPCAIADPSWIKTGKTTFPWWNGFHEENVPFTPGLNTATAKHYIDFCAEAGIPYHSLDGVGNTAWYGGPIVPYQGTDPTKAIAGLDLPAVLAHAKAKGVKIRLWMNWGAAEKHMEHAFPAFQGMGIEGVMLDFMDRDDQEMNRFVRKAVKLAAECKLTVTLHGCPQPTGLERTYPNLLSHEGVMNLEYDKWDKLGIPPEHEVTIPFTRMLAGPLDFHQGSFRTVKPEAFKPQNKAPLVMGTPARTLASYVVYQNHLSMVADYPSAYRGHPGTPILAAIPTTWDDTKVLDAEIGAFAVIARRSGASWHIGAMTDRRERTRKLPLTFLPPGKFRAEISGDDETAKFGLGFRTEVVTGGSTLTLTLAPAGGAYVRIVPVK